LKTEIIEKVKLQERFFAVLLPFLKEHLVSQKRLEEPDFLACLVEQRKVRLLAWEAEQKNSHTAHFRLGYFKVLALCLEPIDRGLLEA
jgi:hypothetical protein